MHVHCPYESQEVSRFTPHVLLSYGLDGAGALCSNFVTVHVPSRKLWSRLTGERDHPPHYIELG